MNRARSLAVNPDWAKLPLFDRKGWKRARFGDVVENVNETCDPAKTVIERFIGLEHLEPGSLHIRTWGSVSDGTTFTRRCRPGQVLFGKRRAYQRKVAVADFDAVVSGDIYVLAPKRDRLLPELLPFLCLTDRFFEHAVGTSAGSLSPRTNWSSLKNFEFALPSINDQLRIEKILSATNELQLSYWNLVSETWSYLISILDEHIASKVQNGKRLGEDLYVKHGWAFEGEFFNDSGQGPILLTPGNFGLDGQLRFSSKNTKYYSGSFPDEYMLSPGDVVMVMTDLTPGAKLLGMPAIVSAGTNLLHNQRIGKLLFDGSKMESKFVYYLLLSEFVRRQIRRTASGSTVRHTSPSRILDTSAHLPPRGKQKPPVATQIPPVMATSNSPS